MAGEFILRGPLGETIINSNYSFSSQVISEHSEFIGSTATISENVKNEYADQVELIYCGQQYSVSNNPTQTYYTDFNNGVWDRGNVGAGLVCHKVTFTKSVVGDLTHFTYFLSPPDIIDVWTSNTSLQADSILCHYKLVLVERSPS